MSTDRISNNLQDQIIRDTYKSLYSRITHYQVITPEHKKLIKQKSVKLAKLSRQITEIIGKPVLITVIEKPQSDNYHVSIGIKNNKIATVSVVITDPIITEELKIEHEE